MLEKLLRRKSVDELTVEDVEGGSEERLKRTLGPIDLTALGIGAIIGAGIFSSTGTAAAGGGDHIGAGPALVISYVLTAVACGFAALCYAELASMIPIAGSAYTYAYVTLGELIAWIIGWDLILEYGVGNVAVAVSWSGYFQAFIEGFGVHLPPWLVSTVAQARAHPDVFAQAPTLDALTQVLDMPQGSLASTVAAHNANAGNRPRFGDGPYVALGPVRAVFVHAEGGLAVDETHRVLGGGDRPIAGLYAAGSTGQGGLLLKGHGHHLAWAFVSGRRAGRNAAREALAR